MNRNDNTFIAILLMFWLMVMLATGHTAKAVSPVADVWTAELTQPVAVKTLEPTPSPSPTPTPVGVQAVQVAKTYLGTPYVWGGTTPKGFDCSGLMQYTYKQLGISISRTTYTQAKEGRAVSRNELKQGDLIFFGQSIHHVGMYVGDGNFIEAPYSGANVRITPLSSRSDYNCARRIVE